MSTRATTRLLGGVLASLLVFRCTESNKAVPAGITSTSAYDAALADQGLCDESGQRFLKFVTRDPKNVAGHTDDGDSRLARMARKHKDFAYDRKYAQTILDKYPDSDMMRPAFLEVGQSYSKNGQLEQARGIFLDYAKRFPDDGDAPWAREQADTLGARIASRRGAC